MHVGAMSVECHLPASRSLKQKRSAVKHIVETANRRLGVAASEVGYQEQWQRTRLGFAAVAPTPGRVTELLDGVDRLIWATPDVEVVSSDRHWLEIDDG